MKFLISSLFILALPYTLIAQIYSVIIDSETSDRIPYVNIWVENENRGTSANENGEFSLLVDSSNQILVFSAIGYKQQKIKAADIHKSILLTPISHEIPEVKVYNTVSKQASVGSFKKSKISSYFICDTLPWIYARYFKYEPKYSETPLLKSIKILTQNDLKSATFNIILYKVNENGGPGEYLHHKNILVTAPKGNKTIEIDLSKLYIEFPKKGFFVGIEWLAIPENKYVIKGPKTDSKEKTQRTTHQPQFATQTDNSVTNNWYYIQGEWRRIWRNISTNDYTVVAIELNLRN
jgi:hypothetical protein